MLLAIALSDNARHKIGGVLRIGRLSRMATWGQALGELLFQLFAPNRSCIFIGLIAFMFWIYLSTRML